MSLPTLEGELVVLDALTVDDAAALFASASDPEVWRWKLVPRPETVDDVRRLIVDVMLRDGRQAFTIRLRSSGEVIGSTTLANFDAHHLTAEMGFTWLDRARWGQGFNEDTKHVLLEHCFDTLGLERIEWQVDDANERSWRALERCGFRYEGTLRSRHVRPDGTRRDSRFYGLLKSEWPLTGNRLIALREERSLAGGEAPGKR